MEWRDLLDRTGYQLLEVPTSAENININTFYTFRRCNLRQNFKLCSNEFFLKSLIASGVDNEGRHDWLDENQKVPPPPSDWVFMWLFRRRCGLGWL